MDRQLALVVDANSETRERVCEILKRFGLTSIDVGTGSEARELLQSRDVGLMIADPDVPGIESVDSLLRASRSARVPVWLAIVDADRSDRGEALLDQGAFDLIVRPPDDAAVHLTVKRAARQAALVESTRRLLQELGQRQGFDVLVGQSPSAERLRDELQRLAGSLEPVLLRGERGTGKGHAARTLHGMSERRDGPFVSLGGDETRDGLPDVPRLRQAFDAAHGGTLFLEDLDELNGETQQALSQLLQGGSGYGKSPRVVGGVVDKSHGRLVPALARCLDREAVQMQPLRERTEDIPLLVRNFVSSVCEINDLPPVQVESRALELLVQYDWPGNDAELRNAMERAVILSPEGKIRPEDLPDVVRGVATSATPAAAAVNASRPFREAKREVVEAFERAYLTDLMERHDGNVTAGSQKAGMLRSALQRLLRKYGLKSAEFRTRRRAARPESKPRPSLES